MELWQQGRYLFLLSLIDHLPRTSAYVHAVSEDDELAAMSSPGKPGPPSTREWSPEVQVMAAVYYQISQLILLTAEKDPSKAKPYPQPVTAFDRVDTERRRQAAVELEAALFPSSITS